MRTMKGIVGTGILVLMSCSILCIYMGCSRTGVREETEFRIESGDFTKSFLAKIKEYGGTPKTINELPKLTMRWQYKADANGFQFMFDNAYQSAFERMVEQAFGEPRRNSKYPHLLYQGKDVGVSILVRFSTNQVHVICLRPESL